MRAKEKAPKPLEPRRVFVATDLSPLGNAAIRAALAQLKPGGKMRLFHASPPIYTAAAAYGPEGPVPVYDPDLSGHHLEKVSHRLERLAATVGAESQVLEHGQPAKAIAEEAKKWGADLVVLSSHGRSGVSKLFFGSVAQKLLARYPGAVLVLRPETAR